MMLFFVVAGLWLLQRGCPGRAGFVLAGASAIKVTPLLLAIWMGWKLLRAIVTERSQVRPPAAALIGFVLGIVFWWWAAPAVVLGPVRTSALLEEYHRAVTGQYVSLDGPIADEQSISGKMLRSKGNQSWYRLFMIISGSEGRPLAGALRITFYAWALFLLAGLLWLCRASWDAQPSDALLCEVAVTVLLGITCGAVAWNHTYLVAWPVLIFAERTVQPSMPWRSRRRRAIWIALLWGLTAIWIVQATAKGKCGNIFPLLLTVPPVAAYTLWRLERCQTDSLLEPATTN
jgi:hypothetical protein